MRDLVPLEATDVGGDRPRSGELTPGDYAAARDHARLLDHIPQFVDVDIPPPVQKRPLSDRRQSVKRFHELWCAFSHECRRQIRDVFTTIAQWRQGDLNRAQPVV